jgi:hypothetical protein
LYIRNEKPAGPARVRIRIEDDVWDITLQDAKTEVCIDRFERYIKGQPYNPRAEVSPPKREINIGVLQGRADVRLGFREVPGAGPGAMIRWDNLGGGFRREPDLTPDQMGYWAKEEPPARSAAEMIAALAQMERQFNNPRESIDVDWSGVLHNERRVSLRMIALFALQASGDLNEMLYALTQDNQPLRLAAIHALRHWVGGRPERDAQLAAFATTKFNYPDVQQARQPLGAVFVELLHDYSDEQAKDWLLIEKLLNRLNDEHQELRDLAYWQLAVRIDPVGAKDSNFDPRGPDAARTIALNKWKTSAKRRFDLKKPKK